jgi:hypothetical protein
VFLASLHDDRTDEQESAWLDWAGLWLHTADLQLQELRALIERHGGPEKVRTIK